MVGKFVYCLGTDFEMKVDIDQDYGAHKAVGLDQMEGHLDIDLDKDLEEKCDYL